MIEFYVDMLYLLSEGNEMPRTVVLHDEDGELPDVVYVLEGRMENDYEENDYEED